MPIAPPFPDGRPTCFRSTVHGTIFGGRDRHIDAVKDGGSFTSVRGFKGEPQRDINFSATWVVAYNCDYEKLDTLRQLVEDGLVSLRVADSVEAVNAAEAHKRLDAGGTRGRMVINWE